MRTDIRDSLLMGVNVALILLLVRVSSSKEGSSYIRHLDVHSGPVKMHNDCSTSHSSPLFDRITMVSGEKLGSIHGWKWMMRGA